MGRRAALAILLACAATRGSSAMSLSSLLRPAAFAATREALHNFKIFFDRGSNKLRTRPDADAPYRGDALEQDVKRMPEDPSMRASPELSREDSVDALFSDVSHASEINYDDVKAADKACVWHCMLNQKVATEDPLMIVRGKGLRVWDASGQEYVDAVSGGLWTVSVGYGRSEIANAVRDQLDQLHFYHCSSANVPAAMFAERLLSKMPEMSRIYYSSSGSEANEKVQSCNLCPCSALFVILLRSVRIVLPPPLPLPPSQLHSLSGCPLKCSFVHFPAFAFSAATCPLSFSFFSASPLISLLLPFLLILFLTDPRLVWQRLSRWCA